MNKHLDTSNPNHLVFEQGNLRTEVMGGVRLDRLDILRLTLKVVNIQKDKAIRQNLDLYHASQVSKFIRKATEHISSGLETMTDHIESLTAEIEDYRLRYFQGETEKVIPTLSPKEKQEALRYLRAKDLNYRTQADIGASGIIGEEINRMLLFYIYCSRKMSTPLHGFTLSPSGTGKTHLLNQVAMLIPSHERIHLTDISEKALYYLKEDELQHKLLVIEDLEGAMSAMYPIRELQSKKEISRLVTMPNEHGQRTTIKQRIVGPVCIAGATTMDELYEDSANRSFLLYLDQSTEQTNRILEYQRKLFSGAIDSYKQEKVRAKLQNVQMMLEPVSVINPYAEKLHIPKHILKPRRTNAHYLNFINAVCFYHQHQREQTIDERTGEVYIKVAKEDIAIANELLKEVLLSKSDKLSGGARAFYQKLTSYTDIKQDSHFTAKELRIHMDVPHSSLFRYLTQLEALGKIEIISEEKWQGYSYKLIADDFENLKQQHEQHFETILSTL